MNPRPRHARHGLPAFSPAIGLREVLESSPDLVFSIDSWGRLVWASSAFEAFTGRRVKDCVGRSCAELVARTEVVGLVRAFLRTRKSAAQSFERAVVLAHPDGTTKRVEARLRFVDSADGDRYLVGVARERAAAPAPAAEAVAPATVPAEADLRPLELAALAPDVVTALETAAVPAGPSQREQELERSLAEARDTAKAKGDFLAMMSHEIRTPMNGVIGMSHLLLQHELPSESRQLVELIRDSSQTLLALINDTLDYSRLEAGRMPVENLDFDLRVTIDQVAGVLHPLAGEKRLELSSRVSAVVPSRLKGDPGRLRQVLLNLGANAIKFVEKGSIQLKVERESEDESHVTLLFQVKDTGPGIEPDAIRRLFEPYSQSDISIARRYGGSGLGLAISRRLVEAMGGRIGVDSKLGEGSTFWFRVQFEKQVVLAGAVAAASAEVALRGVRVLVADTNAGDRGPLSDLLTAWGCSVECAGDGEDALRQLREAAEREEPFAVAVLDRHLEGMNGEKLGEAIRDDQSLAGTRLVMVTNVGRPGDGGRVKAAGFSAYLMKPLEPTQLYEALGEILQPVHDERPREQRPLVTRHSLAEGRRGKLRLLLVDDDPVNQLVTTSALHRVGYNVEVANSGRRAIERTETERWDLILMDMQMPDLDGCRATAAIRAREPGSQRTPIIGLTANADHKPDRDRCLASGMNHVLGKPINLEQLTSMVEKYTSREGRAAESERPAHSPSRLTVVSSHFDAPHAVAPPGQPSKSGQPPQFKLSRPAGPVELEVPVVPDGPALDLEQLETACMGLPALRASLLQTFLHDVPMRVDRLQQAFDASDARRVEFEAHGLRGMCATIGANGCVLLFGEIEDRARDDLAAEARVLLQPARDEVHRTELFIRRFENILNREAA